MIKDPCKGADFYTTEDIDKAREWALTNGAEKAILAWIAEIISHRGSKVYIKDLFLLASQQEQPAMIILSTIKNTLVIGGLRKMK